MMSSLRGGGGGKPKMIFDDGGGGGVGGPSKDADGGDYNNGLFMKNSKVRNNHTQQCTGVHWSSLGAPVTILLT